MIWNRRMEGIRHSEENSVDWKLVGDVSKEGRRLKKRPFHLAVSDHFKGKDLLKRQAG